MAISKAEDLADSVTVNGYRCLLGGMERVSELLECGEPWGDVFVALYWEALDRYGAANGSMRSSLRGEIWPGTVAEAVGCLLGTLTDEEK